MHAGQFCICSERNVNFIYTYIYERNDINATTTKTNNHFRSTNKGNCIYLGTYIYYTPYILCVYIQYLCVYMGFVHCTSFLCFVYLAQWHKYKVTFSLDSFLCAQKVWVGGGGRVAEGVVHSYIPHFAQCHKWHRHKPTMNETLGHIYTFVGICCIHTM